MAVVCVFVFGVGVCVCVWVGVCGGGVRFLVCVLLLWVLVGVGLLVIGFNSFGLVKRELLDSSAAYGSSKFL